jgi:hypothetical protein
MNTDHFEALIANGSESMRRIRFDHDNVARPRDDLFPIDRHPRLAGADDTSFRIWMLMQSWTISRRKIAEKKGSASAVRLALELHCSDSAFPLIFPMQDVEHLLSIQCWRNDLAATPVML